MKNQLQNDHIEYEHNKVTLLSNQWTWLTKNVKINNTMELSLGNITLSELNSFTHRTW